MLMRTTFESVPVVTRRSSNSIRHFFLILQLYKCYYEIGNDEMTKLKELRQGQSGYRAGKLTCRHLAAVIGIIGICAFSPEFAFAAPVTFNTALPVSQGHWVGREQVIYGKADRNGDEIQSARSVTVLGYGVRPNLAVFGVLPVISRDLKLAAGAERNVTGIGDVRVFARYTAYKNDISGGTFRIAPFLGLELPTGENRKSDNLGKLPPGLQPGSGSWDVFGGVIASWATLDWGVDGQVAWQANTGADGINGGNLFKADLAIYKRLLPVEITADTTGFLRGGLEFNYRDEGRTFLGDSADQNSGGKRFYITPGLQYASRLWIIEAAVQIPVTQSLNGSNFRQDYVLRLGLRLNL